MSKTAKKKPTDATDALSAYKAAVQRAVEGDDAPPDAELLASVGKLRVEYEADVRTLRRRVEARRMLDETVPRLEQEAARLEAEAAAVQRGDVPLTSISTVGELADALERFALAKSGQHPEKLAAHEARRNASSAATSAHEVLVSTSCPKLTAEIADLRQQVQRLETAIASRPTMELLESKIAEQRQLVEAIAEGRAPVEYVNDPRPMKEILTGTKLGLKNLESERERVARDAQQTERDRATIRELHSRIGALEARRRDPILGMDWESSPDLRIERPTKTDWRMG